MIENLFLPFKRAYQEALILNSEDDYVLRLIFSTAVAQHLSNRTELLWTILVGPSASGKTSLLLPMMNWSKALCCDDCTSNSMISASDPKGRRIDAKAFGDEDDPFDPSMIRILDGKLLVIKDLTLLLSRDQEASHFWGHMRAAYDGRLSKHSGTVGHQDSGNVRFGFVAGTTDISIDSSLIRASQLGERTLVYRQHQYTTSCKQDMEMGLAVLRDRNTQGSKEKILSRRVRRLLDKAVLQVSSVGPINPQESVPVQCVIELASALAKLRTVPSGDTVSPHERNSRVVKQFGTLCDVSAIISGRRKWSQDEVELCVRICRSSLSTKVRLLFDYMSVKSRSNRQSDWPTAATASKAIGTSHTRFADMQLRQWHNAKLVLRDGNGRYKFRNDLLTKWLDLGFALTPRPKKKGYVI